MKKGILLIATAAALVLGSNNASAESPNCPTWYNFQGVCLEQNATVSVQFDIVNANGTTIYSEVHSGVTTNPSGIFTCHVGEGEPLEGGMPTASELYKGDLTLVTSVNGTEVSHAAFGAVPYATMAAAVGEFTAEDLGNLTPWIEEIEANVNTNIEGIANAEQALTELTPTVKGNTAAIAKLQEDVEINIEGIANAEQAISELTPTVKGNTAAIAKLLDDVNINIEGIANAEQTLIELQEQVKSNTTGIALIEKNYVTTAQLDADMEGFQENIQNALAAYVTTEQLDADMEGFQENIQNALAAYVTTEDLDASMENFMENIDNVYVSKETYAELDEAVYNISNDVQGIQESLRGKASVEKVAEIDDALFEVSKDLFGVQESLRGYVTTTQFNNKVDEIQKALDKLSSQIADLKK